MSRFRVTESSLEKISEGLLRETHERIPSSFFQKNFPFFLSHLIKIILTARAQEEGRKENSPSPAPYFIGITGPVAVGKSTLTSRVCACLSIVLPDSPLVSFSTDGFLFSNASLVEKGLQDKKGFPETYHQETLFALLKALKKRQTALEIPLYSHKIYDIQPEPALLKDLPDIVVIEGLHLLRSEPSRQGLSLPDFFDLTLYLHAEEEDLFSWYLQRFLNLWEDGRKDPQAYHYRYRDWTQDQARHHAQKVWERINHINLHTHILPTQMQASMIITYDAHHQITSLDVRKEIGALRIIKNMREE